MSVQELAKKPRKLVRWAKNFDVEDVTCNNSRPSADDAAKKHEFDPSNPGTDELPTYEDWCGAEVRRLKDNVDELMKKLQKKERDYARLKNKYNISKRRQTDLEEDLQKFTDVKLNFDSELEFLRLQLLEKEREISEYVERGGRLEQGENIVKTMYAEDDGNDVTDEKFMKDFFPSQQYLKLDKYCREYLLYCLLFGAAVFGLVSLVGHSLFVSRLAVGLWTVCLSCLWFVRSRSFRTLKLNYLKRIHEISDHNSQLCSKNASLESMVSELEQELTKVKHEHEDVLPKFKSVSAKLAEEKAKNEELVKLEKSTFEELQGERVRRRRAEEQLEEISVEVLLARERDEVAQCGDLCQELRNTLKLERESKDKLSRENERLIKEIVEMNVKEEKERIQRENELRVKTANEEHNGRLERKAREEDMEIVKKFDKNSNSCESSAEKDGPNGWSMDGMLTDDSKTSALSDEVGRDENANFWKSTVLRKRVSSEVDSLDEFENWKSSGKLAENAGSNGISGHCWLCVWSISHEIRLVLFVGLIASIMIAFKVVLSSNMYIFIVAMCFLGFYTYCKIARNS